jgi:hypothetical protein
MRTIAMPYYRVCNERTNGEYPLAWHPTREDALALFNSTDAKQLGRSFTFNETNPFLPDFFLAEQEQLNPKI